MYGASFGHYVRIGVSFNLSCKKYFNAFVLEKMWQINELLFTREKIMYEGEMVGVHVQWTPFIYSSQGEVIRKTEGMH